MKNMNQLLALALLICIIAVKGQEAAETSLASQLFKQVGQGAASTMGGDMVGWALGAMGLASSSSNEEQELDKIDSELQTIENTLTQINKELVDIDKAIKQLDCDQQFDQAINSIDLITLYYNDYQNFLNTATGSNGGTKAVPPIDCGSNGSASECLSAWANAVLGVNNPQQGIDYSLTNMNIALQGSSPADGIIEACLQPEIIPPPKAGELDIAYYNQVGAVVDKYYTYQVQGVLLLVEAYHFKAWDYAGRPSMSDTNSTYTTVCTDPVNSNVAQACNNAKYAVNTLYENLLQQVALAGVPYSDDDVILHYQTDTTANLYPRSLENFTIAAGDHCPIPLSSSEEPPCGVTTSGNYQNVMFNNITGWRVASSPALAALLQNQTSDQNPGQFLESIGFYNAQDKIFLTSSYYNNFQIGYNHAFTLRCFVDTGIPKSQATQPFCDQSAAGVLLHKEKGNDYGCDNMQYVTPSNLPSNRTGEANAWPMNGYQNFYNAYCYDGSGGGCYTNCQYGTPAYVLNGAGQFTMPSIIVPNDVSCTKGPAKNPGGAYTRCGDNLDAYLSKVVPVPPQSVTEVTMISQRRNLRGK